MSLRRKSPASNPLCPSLPIIHVEAIGVSPQDGAVWDYAKTEFRAIVSKDTDFSDRILVSQPPPWSVHLRRADFQAFLARVWPQIEALQETTPSFPELSITMKNKDCLASALVYLVGCLAGCKESPNAKSKPVEEHLDVAERASAAQLKPAKDRGQEEITALRTATRQAYNDRRFDDLEQTASELRSGKQLAANGGWKIVQFYSALECRDDDLKANWELHDQIHQDWIAAKPESITARVAYADFLTHYAWQARGSGYSDTVTEEGWKLFRTRLALSRKILNEARSLAEKDPVWWLTALRVALGQGWDKTDYEALVEEATSFEPKFWGYDTARAYSLLPRWHGEPGDWETYAEKAAARPNGLGAEAYARIVIHLRGYHDNIFREARVSWPKVLEGLEQMRRNYPDSLEPVSHSAMLATMAEDRALAKEMFDQLGDKYLPEVWRKPERFVHYRKWAETGRW